MKWYEQCINLSLVQGITIGPFFYTILIIHIIQGKLKKVLDGESSSNPDINETIVPKPEMSDFELHSDAIYLRQLGVRLHSSDLLNILLISYTKF